MALRCIATKLIKEDGRTAEVEAHYSDGSVMKHYMTVEEYRHQVLRDEIIKKYSISEEDMNKLENSMQDCFNRLAADEERDL